MQEQVVAVGVVSVFKEFSETFKLYAYKNSDRCDLSIMVTKSLVLTYKLTHEEIKHMFEEYDVIEPANERWGVQLKSKAGQYWFVMIKKHFNAVRITVGDRGMDFNFRVDIGDWKDLIKTYNEQMTTPQAWDDK